MESVSVDRPFYKAWLEGRENNERVARGRNKGDFNFLEFKRIELVSRMKGGQDHG